MLCPSQSHAACFLTHPDCISSFLKICFCVYLRFLFFFLNQVLMSDPLQMSPSPSQVDTSVSTDHCSVVLLLLWAPVVCGSPVSCVCSVLSKEAWFTIPLFLFFLFLFWLSKRVWTHCIFVLLMSPHVRGPWWGFSARPYVWPDSCVWSLSANFLLASSVQKSQVTLQQLVAVAGLEGAFCSFWASAVTKTRPRKNGT